jgi:glutaredoxin
VPLLLLLLPQVMVFSWSGCPFCKNAKALLADLGADFTALELDTIGQEGKQIRAELAAVRMAVGFAS